MFLFIDKDIKIKNTIFYFLTILPKSKPIKSSKKNSR